MDNQERKKGNKKTADLVTYFQKQPVKVTHYESEIKLVQNTQIQEKPQ